MRAFWETHGIFAGAAAVLLIISILCRFTAGMLLKKLMRAAENMSATDNRFLRQCKLKYQNYYELNGGTVNTEVFVGKMLQNVRVGKCSLRLLNFMAGQILLLSVFADGLGACVGLASGETLGEVLPYYLLAFVSLYLFFSVSGLIDVPGRQEALRITMIDFMENRMAERMKSVKEDSAYLEAEEEKARRTAGRPDRPAREANAAEGPGETAERVLVQEAKAAGGAQEAAERYAAKGAREEEPELCAAQQEERLQSPDAEELEALLMEFL